MFYLTAHSHGGLHTIYADTIDDSGGEGFRDGSGPERRKRLAPESVRDLPRKTRGLRGPELGDGPGPQG